MLDESPNGSTPTTTPQLMDMVRQRLSRRSVLGGAAAVSAA